MSVGGSSNCCAPLPAADTVKNGGPSPQQVAPDTEAKGGPAVDGCMAPPPPPAPVTCATPVEAPAPAPTEYTNGGPAEDGCCDIGAAAAAAQNQPVTGTTPAPGAVDPNTGQPVAGTTPAGPPAPIAAPETPAPTTASTSTSTSTPAPTSETPGATTPVDTPGSGPAAAGPASSLSTWPQWTQALTDLGLDAANIARIGEQQVTNEQLAAIYMSIRDELKAQQQLPPAPGSGPGTTTPTPGATGGWNPLWEQKFLALGVPANEVAQIKQIAMQQGADDARLQQLYDQIAANLAQQKQQGAPTDPNAPVTWTPQIEQAFADLGMPKEYIDAYKSMGANAAGLEAAYNHAAERAKTFADTGYYDKLKAAGMQDLEIWQRFVLADKPATADELDKIVNDLEWQQAPAWKKMAQHAITFLPGGELVQYALGRKLVSGSQIDRTNPMNVGFAALSGLAAFATVRGWMNVRSGWNAINAGLPELTKAGGAIDDAVLGSLKSGGLGTRIQSYIPFTKTHSLVQGLGTVESAAKLFNNGGAERLLASGADGALQVSTLQQMFADISEGRMLVQGPRNAYIGAIGMPFKALKSGPVSLVQGGSFETAKGIVNVPDVLKTAKGLSRPDQILAGMVEAGGTKVGSNPTWLRNAQSFVDDVSAIGGNDRLGIGKLMAGNAAQALGAGQSSGVLGLLGKVKPGPTEYFAKLAGNLNDPHWYPALAATTASEFPGLSAASLEAARGALVAPSVVEAALPAAASAVEDVAAAAAAPLVGAGGAGAVPVAAAAGGAAAVGLTDGVPQVADEIAGLSGQLGKVADTGTTATQRALQTMIDSADAGATQRADGSMLLEWLDGRKVEYLADGGLVQTAADGTRSTFSASFLANQADQSLKEALLPRLGQLQLPLGFAS
jgi:hypothetical protein